MLQNRVDPCGNIIMTPARGAWMGNRGLIHNPDRRIVRAFKLLAWITCRLSFKDRKRPVMAAGQYTELFFLDEATSFAAGHRPCFECRREDAVKFKALWLQGNPGFGFTMKTRIGEIDKVLQEERMDDKYAKRMFEEEGRKLPNGVFVLCADKPFLVFDGHLYGWTPFGYGESGLVGSDKYPVLTPKSMVNTFCAGYIPQIADLTPMEDSI